MKKGVHARQLVKVQNMLVCICNASLRSTLASGYLGTRHFRKSGPSAARWWQSLRNRSNRFLHVRDQYRVLVHARRIVGCFLSKLMCVAWSIHGQIVASGSGLTYPLPYGISL